LVKPENQPKAGLLNKRCSRLAPALSVTEFIIVADMIWVTLFFAYQVVLKNPPDWF